MATIRMGVTLRGRDATRHDPAGPYRLIQISDLDDAGAFRNRDFVRITPRESFNRELLLRSGDLIFPNRGSRTTAAVFDDSDLPALVGPQFFIIRPVSDEILGAYLAWMLRTREAFSYFDANRRGSNVLTLQKPALEAFELPVPPLEVQHAIVEIDRLGHLASALESRLAVLRSLHLEQSLLQRAKLP
ncbi:restriction endonuclease subunit S [Verrucomicrobiaceae bacterium E54]|nr:restriction endonuclease subunit S [Verrucomicrobiaceae bacterium E54]